MRTRILCLVAFLVCLVVFANRARATVLQDGPAVPELHDAGSASAPAPADKLHDPLSSPQGAIDDVKAAKKIGWGVGLLAILVLASRIAARAGGVFSFLGKGKAALVIGAGAAVSATAYNAAAERGSWFAVLLAAIVAGAAYWDAHAGKAAEPK